MGNDIGTYATLIEAVLAHAREIPEKPAVCFKKTVLNYRELARQMQVSAGILSSRYGIGEGDRVMLSGLSKPEYIVFFLGVQYLHAVTIPLDKVWLEDTVVKMYDFISPKCVITDMKFTREEVKRISMKELYAEVVSGGTGGDPAGGNAMDYTLPDPELVAEMLFTTGTTGTPKGAMLTYKNIRSITKNNIYGVEFQNDDVVLDALPLCHSLGLREARMTLYAGATLVIQNGFTFPKELRANMDEYKCTGFVCVPATMERLTRTVKDFAELFGRFRYLEIGAGSLSYDLKKRLPKLLPKSDIFNTWGSSETGGVIFLDVKRRHDKITALGRPVSTAEIRVIGENGKAIKATSIDNAGRLSIRGAMTMAGYFNMPEVNAETIVDGWLITNDLVYTDEEGFVYMLGRADDIINTGGEKVSPLEVENVATEFPAVRDAACIGVADEILGQVPALFVAVDDPFSVEELRHFLAERLEPFKLPGEIIRIGEIPRNRMKKLDRKAVRRLWDEKNAEPAVDATLLESILSRHSVRQFTEERIPREVLEKLVQAGIQAPSGHNLQTWRFTVVRNKEKIEEIRETGAGVAAREKTGFYGFNNPDTLILVSNDIRNDCGIQDASCAAENILLAAHSMGLGACWLNGLMRICDQPEIRGLLDSLEIPSTHKVWAMIALGYPAAGDKTPARKTDVVSWVE